MTSRIGIEKKSHLYIIISFYYSNQQRPETKPIKINSTSNGNNMLKERISTPKQLGFSFEDVKVDDSDEIYNSPPRRKEYSTQLKTSNSTISDHNNNNSSNHIPKQHSFNQQMLLESLLDNDDEDQIDNNRAIKKTNRLSQKFQSNNDSNDAFLLLDAHEHLTVS
jgi:hypothetical protein